MGVEGCTEQNLHRHKKKTEDDTGRVEACNKLLCSCPLRRVEQGQWHFLVLDKPQDLDKSRIGEQKTCISPSDSNQYPTQHSVHYSGLSMNATLH